MYENYYNKSSKTHVFLIIYSVIKNTNHNFAPQNYIDID